jgi:hypothetical protein
MKRLCYFKICEKDQPIQWEDWHWYQRIRQSELCPPLVMSNGEKIYICIYMLKFSNILSKDPFWWKYVEANANVANYFFGFLQFLLR